MVEKIVIIDLGQGWFNFENIPQKDRYMKINNLNCGNKRKALETAKKINPNFAYEIKQEEHLKLLAAGKGLM